MDYKNLQTYSFGELKKMASEMNLKNKKSKQEYIDDITNAFEYYRNYKKDKIDKYERIRQLGNKGKEGTTYLVKNVDNNKKYAMKTFRKSKSSSTLKNEYHLQQKASSVGISPRVVEYDTVSKYIVMEKMEDHLIDIMKKQKGILTKGQQIDIINIFKKLDDIGVFHGDSNILNYMVKDGRIYIIDFGFAKEIDSGLIKKLGTNSPNLRIMTLGLILKLKELNCSSSSWKYLMKHISKEEIEKFRI